ncbi:MDR family MFS transporter [Demetria terragena]|uniref:MDR family MFS transporter n=1 Tax=Demetria terragena TaxID=63959 RepID=UPI001FDF3627|nr:MDR family MFS transporter [Demetria terragena]
MPSTSPNPADSLAASNLPSTDETMSGKTPPVVRLLVLATFVVILNETIMVNAIPRLMADLGVTEVAAQWVSTIFMLTMAAVIPTTGWFLQRFSTRQAYATAMSTFIVGTALSAIAPNLPVLLGGRAIQAAGTAVMLPLLMTTLMTVVPQSDRGRVMGNVTLAMSVAPAMGPVVSGGLLALGSWRLMFVSMLPLAAVVTWFGLKRLDNIGETRTGSIDVLSVGLAALGFGSLVYGLSHFESGIRATPVGFTVAGLVVVATFVIRQLHLQRSGTPLLDLRVFRSGTYAISVALMSVGFMAMLGSMILLPLYLQSVRGLTPLEAGLLVMPGGILMGLAGPRVGRTFDRVGARPLVIPGTVGVTLALAGFSQVSQTMPFWQLLGLHILLMLALACTFTPVFTIGLSTQPPHLYSHGSSILSTLQQVAAAFGTALVITVMSARSAALAEGGASAIAAQLGGMKLAFGISAAISLVVIALALALPNRAAKNVEELQGEAEEYAPA